MQVVIDIDEYDYKKAMELVSEGVFDYNGTTAHLFRSVINGTLLPKGHGRLIDVSDLTPDSDYEDGTFYSVSIRQINDAPTIIEADKEE